MRSPLRLSVIPRAAFLTLVACVVVRADAPADAFDDPPLPGAVARLGTTRFRQACNTLAWTPDGKTLVSSGQDGLVRFWDPADGKQVRQFKPAWGGVTALAYSPDGKHLLLGGGDGSVHFLDDAIGREVRAVGAPTVQPQQVTALALNPDDGTVLAAGADGSVGDRDPSTGASASLTDAPRNFRVQPRAAVSPDGRSYAVWGGDDLLTVYDAAGKERFHATTQIAQLDGLLFSPDGKTLAAWAPLSSQIALWDVATGKETSRVKTARLLAHQIAFSPDGKSVASRGSDGLLHVWDPASGQELQKMPLQHGAPGGSAAYVVTPIAFSPDGKTLAVALGTAIHVLDLAAGGEVGNFVGHAAPVQDVRFTPDGARVVTCARDGTAGIWDAANGKLTAWRVRPEGSVPVAVIAPDGQSVFVGQQGGVGRWDLTADKAVDRPVVAKLQGAVFALALSADGKTLAGAGAGRSVYVWDVETGKDKGTAPEPGVNPAVALSPDGGLLAVTGNGAPLRLLDVTAGLEGRRVEEAPGAPGAPPSPFPPTGFRSVTQLVFAPDGRSFAVLWNDDVSVYETTTGRERMRVTRPNLQVMHAAFSADGRLLAVAANNGTVVVLDGADGREAAELSAGPAGVTALAFSPDGTRLATAEADGAALIWEGKDWAARRPGAPEPSADEVARRWDDLQSGDAVRAYRAVQALARSPKAVPFLKEKLLAVAAVDEKRVAALIKKLDDDGQQVRDAAEAELAGMGSQAVPYLREALSASPSAEAKRRLQGLLGPRKGGAAVPEEVRDLRALETLERSGTVDAVESLRALAKDASNAEVRREAEVALARTSAPR